MEGHPAVHLARQEVHRNPAHRVARRDAPQEVHRNPAHQVARRGVRRDARQEALRAVHLDVPQAARLDADVAALHELHAQQRKHRAQAVRRTTARVDVDANEQQTRQLFWPNKTVMVYNLLKLILVYLNFLP